LLEFLNLWIRKTREERVMMNTLTIFSNTLTAIQCQNPVLGLSSNTNSSPSSSRN
jgi:hypothetical protein